MLRGHLFRKCILLPLLMRTRLLTIAIRMYIRLACMCWVGREGVLGVNKSYPAARYSYFFSSSVLFTRLFPMMILMCLCIPDYLCTAHSCEAVMHILANNLF